MLKFIGGHVSSIDGISIYPIISFIIFFLFFIGVTYYVITASKSSMDKMSEMPLQDDEVSNSIPDNSDTNR